jgi:hypothetical protein
MPVNDWGDARSTVANRWITDDLYLRSHLIARL